MPWFEVLPWALSVVLALACVALVPRHGQTMLAVTPPYGSNVFSVLNRDPGPGEPTRWDSTLADPMKRVYGVVALLPNLSGNGHVLLV